MIAILDYGAGNLTSVRLAFERLGAGAQVVTKAEEASRADRLIFPGVGSAKSGMEGLCGRGFDRVLREAFAAGKPILAICLGMQMLLERSEEDGGVAGLGLVPGSVVEFAFPAEERVKVPHMGWNAVHVPHPHPVFEGIPDNTAFYFVHSFYAAPTNPQDTAGETEYAGKHFTSAVARGSLIGTQFHPERSGAAGLALLKNFLAWDGKSCC
ncbi:MAG: imidazole glycerol phosphate synthase subunit HisH [Victivallales bacterium]|nr:imidazole glycerol phosphate synthase subunit HisH [Victivallales bacterium]